MVRGVQVQRVGATCRVEGGLWMDVRIKSRVTGVRECDFVKRQSQAPGSSYQRLSPTGPLNHDKFWASIMTKATRLATEVPKWQLSAE